MQLDTSFERDLRDAVMDDVEQQTDRLVEKAIEKSHDRLREVASRNDYDVDNVIDSLKGPDVTRTGGEIVVEWVWTHEAASLFGTGTDDHVIKGNPTLAFKWPGGPKGPGQTHFYSKVEVSGIEQSRYARHGLRWLESELGKVGN